LCVVHRDLYSFPTRRSSDLIALTSTAVFAPVEGTEVESLLVYNTATAGNVTPGFYYWFNNKWERIVNQTQLEEAISDITDLQGRSEEHTSELQSRENLVCRL